MPAPSEYKVIVGEHRRQLDRLTIRRGASRMKDLYDTAQHEIAARLARVAPAKTPFTHHVLRQMMGQVIDGTTTLAVRMAGELGSTTREAQAESLDSVISGVKKMERTFVGTTPMLRVQEAARFAGVVDKRRTSLMRMHKTSMAHYGARLVGQIEGALAQSIVSGDAVDDAVGRVRDVAKNEWWQAERIVRTETAWAYNATHADGVQEVKEDVPDIRQRWTEHVSDDGAPLDDRVGEDSIVLHGQVTKPGGLFTMPSDPRVDASMWNKQWAHPPNRPNDRSVLVPWSPRWGVPGWEWIGGARVPAK